MSRSTLTTRRMRPLTVAVAIHLAFAGGLLATSTWHAEAYAQTATRTYNIPAGALGTVLTRFSSESGILIAAPAELVAGKSSKGLQGNFNTDTALYALLSGTGLEAVQETNGQYRLQITDKTTTLPTVTVTALTETANGPVGGLVAKRSSTATKTDTPLSETPQSVSVISREQIEAQAADSLDQSLQYTAGVSMFEGGGTRSVGTRIVVRGFSTLGKTALLLNGSRMPTNSLTGSMEPYHFERIELLKGPASIMYGQAAPGGVMNLVSKRPTVEPVREIELQAGSWDRKQLAFDLGGPATEDGRIRYRLTALQRDSNTMIKEYANDKTSFSGALEWQLTDSTLLTLLGSYDKTRAAFDAGKPLDGTLLPHPAGKISRTLFIGEPGQDYYKGKGNTLGYQLEHRFNDAWQFRQNVLTYDRDIDWAYTAINERVNPLAPRLAGREIVERFDGDKGLSIDNQLHGKVKLGNVEHTLLFGLDYSKNDFTRSQRLGFLPPIDLFNPTYGTQAIYGRTYSGGDRGKQSGFYAQDQIKFDQWILLVGGRYDSTRNDAGLDTATEKASAFTPRLGLMYQFNNGITPYYSYSRSFQPTANMDFYGNRFKPSTGTQHEIGVKYVPHGIEASITMAIYEITQTNVQTSDPAHMGYMVQTGEVRSRGFEIEGRTQLNRQLGLIATLATTDATITKSNLGDVGTPPAAVPRNTASFWADYKFEAIPGMSAAFGARYVGRQEVMRMAVPSYTVYDASLRYQWDKWQFALNIKNLTDKNYVAACPSVCYYGEERNALLTARYRW